MNYDTTETEKFRPANWLFLLFVLLIAIFLSFLCGHFIYDSFADRFGFHLSVCLACAGVLTLDGGAWMWKSMIPASKTDSQEWLAWCMAIGDLGFACLTGGYHLMQLLKGANPPAWLGEVVGLIMVVALVGNVGGGFVYYLLSPAAQEARRERRARRLYAAELWTLQDKMMLEHAHDDATEAARYRVESFRNEFKTRNSATTTPRSGLADAEKLRLMKVKMEDAATAATDALAPARQPRAIAPAANDEADDATPPRYQNGDSFHAAPRI